METQIMVRPLWKTPTMSVISARMTSPNDAAYT
jgi:hypothetical protein